ncbi:MAG: hypothetical protein KAH32_02420 [Chlamydiia bacterium]|nr:hypothetical protein [Chlamydiia bacterium]
MAKEKVSEDKKNFFANIVDKDISTPEDAKNAIEQATVDINDFFSNAIKELSNVSNDDDSEGENADGVLKILDGIKDQLTDSMSSLQEASEHLGGDGEMPSDPQVREALDSLGPDVKREYDNLMEKTQQNIKDLKKKVAESLNISEEQMNEIENADNISRSKMKDARSGARHFKG